MREKLHPVYFDNIPSPAMVVSCYTIAADVKIISAVMAPDPLGIQLGVEEDKDEVTESDCNRSI